MATYSSSKYLYRSTLSVPNKIKTQEREVLMRTRYSTDKKNQSSAVLVSCFWPKKLIGH